MLWFNFPQATFHKSNLSLPRKYQLAKQEWQSRVYDDDMEFFVQTFFFREKY